MTRKGQSIYWYLGIGFALTMGAIVALVVIAANTVNRESQGTQEDIARYITKSRYEAAKQSLMPMIYWQDAYDRMSKSWDQRWASWEFGNYLDSLDVDAAMLFGRDGHLIQFHENRRLKRVSAEEVAYNENVINLIDAISQTPRSGPPIVRTAMVQLAGMQFFAAAGRLTPENTKTFTTPDKDITVIFLFRATAASYQALFDGFHLQGVQITTDNTVVPGKAGMVLRDLDNDEVGWLWWTPFRPSARFTSVVLPWTILVLILFAIMQIAILRNWLRSQRELARVQASAEAALHESRAKSAFIGTISHELRTPLNAVIGFSDLLKHRMFGPLGAPQYEEYAEHIHASGTSLLGIVNDVIEISRVEGHDTALQIEPCDALLAANDAIEDQMAHAQSKNIRLESVGSRESIFCLASSKSLTQSIARLIDNAIKFSPAGSTVSIDVQKTAAVHFSIRDHGIGIEPERLADIGRPFIQVEGHLARSNGGIGLGLAISRGLVELMGGSLKIDSALGAGTCVTITLPFAPGQHTTASVPGAESIAA